MSVHSASGTRVDSVALCGVANKHNSTLVALPEKIAKFTPLAVFAANPGMRIIIIGNTDERASDAHNMALGRRRSDAAKAYLITHGIDAVRIEVTSDGERNPTAEGTSAAAQARNRRAEFRLLIASDYLVSPRL